MQYGTTGVTHLMSFGETSVFVVAGYGFCSLLSPYYVWHDNLFDLTESHTLHISPHSAGLRPTATVYVEKFIHIRQ